MLHTTRVNSTENAIVVAGSIAGILYFLYAVRRWIKRIAVWLGKQVIKLRPDSAADSLHIPPVDMDDVSRPVGTSGAVTKTVAKYITYGTEQLFAYTITREGFPGTRYLVVRSHTWQQRQFLLTLNRDEANAKWSEWYNEWKQKELGGASGTGLSGEPPFQS